MFSLKSSILRYKWEVRSLSLALSLPLVALFRMWCHIFHIFRFVIFTRNKLGTIKRMYKWNHQHVINCPANVISVPQEIFGLFLSSTGFFQCVGPSAFSFPNWLTVFLCSRECINVVNPTPFFQSCVFDMCQFNGQQHVLCDQLQAYTDACQSAGAKVHQWRSPDFCRKSSAFEQDKLSFLQRGSLSSLLLVGWGYRTSWLQAVFSSGILWGQSH